MNTPKGGKMFSYRYPAVLLAVILLIPFAARAQEKSTKAAPAKPAAAPAKPAAAPAKPAAAATGNTAHGPTTSNVAHGPTTSNPAAHGPTTSNPAAHGPTTSNPAAAHGVTTANGSHDVTTANGRHGATTGTTGRGPVAGGREAGANTRMTAGGHAVPRDSRVVHGANGSEVRMRANGRPGDVHVANREGRNMDIHHGLNGNRRVEVERADHSRIVAERGGRGYVQHPYRYGNREFAHRTYYDHGRAYDRYYGHYYYRGAYVDYYTPAVYYRPAFYGWAYNPWVAPVPYAWGWAGNPWYGYYGAYFTPYPVYTSASIWLTDYLISTSLAAAYQANAEAQTEAANAGPPPQDMAPLTPEVKDMIAAEVQRQIALENAEAQAAQTAAPDPASSSVQRMLSDNVQHVFVAGHDLDVVDGTGAECGISEGDALQLTGPPPPDATAASLIVLSSKGRIECRRGATVSVNIADLQEMQNHMRETIDQGMGQMQQGKGLPPVPSSAAGAPVTAAFVAAAPPQDPNAATEITQEAQQADQAEKEALAPAAGGPSAANDQITATAPVQAPAPIAAPAAPPATISLGQSIDDVTAIEGQPTRIVDLGTKKIYVFKDGIKVTFKNGKASDIQ